MKKEDKDITSWRQGLKEYEIKRKTLNWKEIPLVKHFTTKEAKEKEIEYHPILGKYADVDRDENVRMQESQLLQKKAEQKSHTVSKYELDYDPINLNMKPSASPARESSYTKPRIVPVNQVDYNIINNERLGDEYFKNIKYNGVRKKEYVKHAPNVQKIDYNILTNKYFRDDEGRKQMEKEMENTKISEKFNATRIYNPLVGEFYNKEKEREYNEHRTQEQQTHVQRFIQRLPPSLRYRESVSLDPTKEVSEETKKVDLKKELAKSRYKLKYQLEKEYRERSEIQNMVNDDRAKNRIYDGKFYEHLKKGYDIISQNVVDPSMIKTKPKDEYSTWDKVQMNATKSNLDFQGRSSSLGRSSLLGKGPEEIHTLNTDPNFMNSESTPMAHVRKGFQTSIKPSENVFNSRSSVEVPNKSMQGSNLQSVGKLDLNNARASAIDFNREKRSLSEVYKSLNLKDPYARSREPAFNLADQYSAYEVKPRYSVETDKNIPGIPVKENQLRFSMVQTGGFKRLMEGS